MAIPVKGQMDVLVVTAIERFLRTGGRTVFS